MGHTRGNDPANPVTEQQSLNSDIFHVFGMTKREHFSAMAMQGMLALSVNVQAAVAAESAVMYADALIEALNAE